MYVFFHRGRLIPKVPEDNRSDGAQIRCTYAGACGVSNGYEALCKVKCIYEGILMCVLEVLMWR